METRLDLINYAWYEIFKNPSRVITPAVGGTCDRHTVAAALVSGSRHDQWERLKVHLSKAMLSTSLYADTSGRVKRRCRDMRKSDALGILIHALTMSEYLYASVFPEGGWGGQAAQPDSRGSGKSDVGKYGAAAETKGWLDRWGVGLMNQA